MTSSEHPVTRGTTGRRLVLLREVAPRRGVSALSRVAGLTVATASDFSRSGVTVDEVEGAGAILFDHLGVALFLGDPDQLKALEAEARREGSDVEALERERYVHAYAEELEVLGAADSEADFTWGLAATKASQSKLSGKGIKVAVLDTGFDQKHPDFPRRNVTAQSFVKKLTAQDGHGHGTHCIGTACGARRPFLPPRYGVACEADIWAGKVLDDGGGGSDAQILAGVNWAVAGGCRVASLSLGAEVGPDDKPSRVFETAGNRALKAGTICVAAAGNESDRKSGLYAPVGHPANCKSFLAVGAVDAKLKVAWFSNRSMNETGGQVDVVAPGVDVLSAFPMPERSRRLSGTSMATPHVAGIVALLAEANPEASGADLWKLLTGSAKTLKLPVDDVGAGLVQAP